QSLPVAGCVAGNVVHRGGIVEIHTDRGLVRQRVGHRLQDVEGQNPPAGGVDDEVRGQDLDPAVATVPAHAGDGGGARHEPVHAATLADLDVGARLHQQ